MSTYRVWGWGASDGEVPRAADVREFARGLESVLGFDSHQLARRAANRIRTIYG